ncbi:hypothetical protein EWW49_26035 [Pseudomonas syringae]|uniref:hypothetical protein n=1 Tax=Pseudomonas sp. MWU16-30316 TaxID=2878093 RepID=UPI0011044D80|nr:hypothetical protein [Pseudomonas sp. MWU16-30316]TFZ34287.1 hypothetical protein EWW49_26035 [Pseudomonas syringae]
MTRTYAPYGVLRDRYIHTHVGQRLTLVETARMINGKWSVRIDDPDVYRGVLDASQVALEQENMAVYVDLWQKEHFSIFTLYVCRAATASIFGKIERVARGAASSKIRNVRVGLRHP